MKKLRNRLYIALLPLQILLVGLAVWTFFLLFNLGALVSDARTSHEEYAQSLEDAMMRLHELQLLVDMTAELDGKTLRDDIDEVRGEYQMAFDQVYTLAQKRSSVDWSEVVAQNTELNAALDLLQRNLNDPLIATRRADIVLICDRLERHLDEVSNQVIDDLLNLQSEFRGRTRISFAVLTGGILLGVFGTLLISRQIGRMILSPLEKLEISLEEVSKGNLDVSTGLKRQDEIGRLAGVFDEMVTRLRDYRNLTDQKLLTTTRAFRSVLQRTPHPILFLTSDLNIFFANPPAGSLLEAPEFKKGLPLALRKFVESALESGDVEVQDRLSDALRLNVAHQPQYFLATAFPVDLVDTSNASSAGLEAEGVALLLQDVTTMKLADNLKVNVVATVSHELKTPLTSARMSLYLLSEESVGPLNEEQKELVDTAKEDLERQLATIQNLLDLSRLEQSDKKLRMEPCRANEIIHASIRAHHDAAEAGIVDFVEEPDESDPWILADPKRIEIVLNNFLSNALRHAPAGTDIRVQVIASDGQVRFNVCDSGSGVPEDIRDHIFERFAQGEDSSKHGSAGLGLHIAKEIVTNHDGVIGCESEPGEGSVFYFVLQSIEKPSYQPTTDIDHASKENNISR